MAIRNQRTGGKHPALNTGHLTATNFMENWKSQE